jgi:trigger factor
MATVSLHEKENLSAELHVNIEKSDYLAKVNEEIDSIRHKMTFKGFRPGKTPATFVRRMYGDGILADVIMKIVNQEIDKFMREQQINTMGKPIALSELDFNINDLKDYELNFEIGLQPKFELQGLEATDVYEYHDVIVDESDLDEEIKRLRRAFGTRSEVSGPVQTGDVVHFKAKELGKEDGYETEFAELFESMSDEGQELVEGKSVGDTCTANIFKLGKSQSEKYVRKYLLRLDDNDHRPIERLFYLEIIKVTRIELTELNQELFDRVWPGGQVTSETEAREKMRLEIKNEFGDSTDSLFFYNLLDELESKNPINLPEEFLKRDMSSNDEADTSEMSETDYKQFFDSLRRRLLINSIVKKFNVSVSDEDMLAEIKQYVRQEILGPQGSDEYLDQIAAMILENEKFANVRERSFERIQLRKVIGATKEAVKLDIIPTTKDKFAELMKELNLRLEARKTENPESEFSVNHPGELVAE